MKNNLKTLSNYIIEKLKVGKSQNQSGITKIGKCEVINDVFCDGLPPEYMDAIIKAYLKSPMKSKLKPSKIEVIGAKDLYQTYKDTFNFDDINDIHWCNNAYPAILVYYVPPTSRLRIDTILNSLPHIHMPLVLGDDKGLYTSKNTQNVSGWRDLECKFIKPRCIDHNTHTFVTGIIYYVKENATKKLLNPDTVYNNLLEYYKLSIANREIYLKKQDETFYTYTIDFIRADAELLKEREKQARKHYREEHWTDAEQEEYWKLSDKKLEIMCNNLKKMMKP